MRPIMPFAALGLALALASAVATTAALADDTHIQISIKDHHFDPATPTVPAGQPVVIDVKNLDTTPAEFESKTLRVEKVVTGGGSISVRVRALPPGRYRFFDDYHEATTVGFLVVK